MGNLNVVLVLLLVVSVLVLAWKWEEARVDATMYREQAKAEARMAVVYCKKLQQEELQNEALVDRMSRMQREGFIDLGLTDDDGDMSESDRVDRLRRTDHGSMETADWDDSRPGDLIYFD